MKTFGKIVLTTAALAAATTFAFTGPASAAYPDKPINYIIAYKPGGESDIAARLQQPFFKKMFGQELIISYKTGGGGAVAWAQLNGMKGDGYTIMGTNLPHIIIMPAEKDVGFTTDSLVNVYFFHFTPSAIVVRDDSPFKTVQDLIDYAKKNPGRVTMSGTGKGTTTHLVSVMFDKLVGVRTTYVPFAGTAPAATALLGGQVMAQWGYPTVVAQYPGTRMLAVAMEKRHPSFPKVPTFKELGINLLDGTYRGIAVPKSTPEAIRQKLSDMIGKVNHNPAFIKKMEKAGFAMMDVPYGPSMDKFMAQQKARVLAVAKVAGIIK